MALERIPADIKAAAGVSRKRLGVTIYHDSILLE